ncbi:poly(A)-specific ribonuclease PARN-like, partial [Phalaenopsis equestris]|uniref:poly(A)-specific ribonuclease PARN-like n=1 Tax=Phalaenopsis equestris TaxID=78828 RepID=UPI0009E3E25D
NVADSIFNKIIKASITNWRKVISHNGREPKAVCVVLTSSEEDKKALLIEIQNLEDEKNLKLRGFKHVIDLISSSHKAIVLYNCLHEFTIIHQRFLSPLSATLSEFMCPLRLLFSNVIDLNHLFKGFGPLRKVKNILSALSNLQRQYYVLIELEVPMRAEDGNQSVSSPKPDDDDDETGLQIDTTKRVSTDNIFFLWGFGGVISAMELKNHLLLIHPVFLTDFGVLLTDKSCVDVVFGRMGAART